MSELPSRRVHPGRLTVSRASGEVMSSIGARAAVYGMRKFLKQPYNAVVGTLSRCLVLPHLEKFEEVIEKHLSATETTAQYEARMKSTPERRAEHIVEALLNFSVDLMVGTVLQVVGQRFFDDLLKIPAVGMKEQSVLAFADRAVQLGAFTVLNPIAPSINKSAQSSLSGMLKKVLNSVGVNVDEKKTDKFASQIMNIRVPSALGTAAATVMHYNYLKTHPTQR